MMEPRDPPPPPSPSAGGRSFAVIGAAAGAIPASPVIVSVPHAGRDYPARLRTMARVSPEALAVLEDRHVDAVALAARGREALVIQHRARAWIDLNRAEGERDPRLESGGRRIGAQAASAKVRSGLGLVPRRTGATGDLWAGRIPAAEVDRRIETDHRPYHAALAALLAAARARFGCAILLDLHSMPALPGEDAVPIVVGDRFGQAAAGRFVARVEGEIAAAGYRHALNAPYAGGHILDRHGRVAAGVHAIQLELDRALYLRDGEPAGPGFARAVALVRGILDALADEALSAPGALAAE